MSVRVAARVRGKNLDGEAPDQCVRCEKGNRIYWQTPEANEAKDFQFANVFGQSSSQDEVYAGYGAPIVKDAFDGYNSSLFCYGQTGSGKTHTMFSDDGIVPRALKDLFTQIEAKKSDTETYYVEAAFYEVYLENVRDLFVPASAKAPPLRMRENPKTGPYLEGLTWLMPTTAEEALSNFRAGVQSLTTAFRGTHHSSRSHGVLQLKVTQEKKSPDTPKPIIKEARLNFVDLAGTDRSTDLAGEMARELANINKSLSALGIVIERLGQSSAPGGKGIMVPYRDSTLTFLLKESLGGNAKLAVLATVSPSTTSSQDTLGTLKWVERANKIKKEVVVNEDPKDKLIRELKADIKKLTAILRGETVPEPADEGDGGDDGGDAGPGESAAGGGGDSGGGGGPPGSKPAPDPGPVDHMALLDQIEQTAQLLDEASQSWEEKLAAAKAKADTMYAEAEKAAKSAAPLTARGTHELKGARAIEASSMPHLVNLNEDAHKSESMLCFLPAGGKSRVGKADARLMPDIILTGVNVEREHGLIENDGKGNIVFHPMPRAQTHINGREVAGPTALHHGDRLIFGVNDVFRLSYPEDPASKAAPGTPRQHSQRSSRNSPPTSGERGAGGKATFDTPRRANAFTRRNSTLANATWQEAQQEMLASQGLLAEGPAGYDEDEDWLAAESEELKEKRQEMRTLRDVCSRLSGLHDKKQAELEEKMRTLNAAYNEALEDLESEAMAMGNDEPDEEALADLEIEIRAKQEALYADVESCMADLEHRRKERDGLENYFYGVDFKRNQEKALQRELVRIIPMIREVNEISQLLQRPTVFGHKIRPKTVIINNETMEEGELVVTVSRTDGVKGVSEWPQFKFINAVHIIRDMHIKWREAREGGLGEAEAIRTAQVEALQEGDTNPYEDAGKGTLAIGFATLFLMNLAYGEEVEDEAMPILDADSGAKAGTVSVCVKMLGSPVEGQADNPAALIGHKFMFQLTLRSMSGLSEDHRCIFSEFQPQAAEGGPGSAAHPVTGVLGGVACTPTIVRNNAAGTPFDVSFSKTYTVPCVDQAFLDFLDQDCMRFEVFSKPLAETAGGADPSAMDLKSSQFQDTPRPRPGAIEAQQTRSASVDYSPTSSPTSSVAGGDSSAAGSPAGSPTNPFKGLSSMQYQFLISVDIHELGVAGYNAVSKKVDNQIQGRMVYRLRHNHQKRVILTFSRDIDRLIVDGCEAVLLGKVATQGKPCPLSVINTKKYLDGRPLATSKDPSDRSEFNQVTVTAKWDPRLASEDLNSVSKKGDRVEMQLMLYLKVQGVQEPLCFRETFWAKFYKEGSNFKQTSGKSAFVNGLGERRSLCLVTGTGK